MLISYTKDYINYLTKDSIYPGCDLIRAIACLSVLMFHSTFIKVAKIGYWGVDLFFVLSGFLIYHRLINLDIMNQNWKIKFQLITKFYISRFVRIYPTYVFVLILHAYTVYNHMHLTHLAEVPNKQEWLKIISWSLLMPYPVHFMSPLGVWSLTIEWWFYIFSPFLFIAVTYADKKKLGVIFITILFFAFIIIRIHLILSDNNSFGAFRYYFEFVCHLDEIIAGIIAAVCTIRFDISSNLKRISATIGIMIILTTIIYMLYNPEKWHNNTLMREELIFLSSCLGSGFAFLIIALYQYKHRSKLVNIFARIAYPLYLVYPIVFSYNTNIENAICNGIVAALLISFFIEYPFLRRKINVNVISPLNNTIPSSINTTSSQVNL